MPEDKKPVGKPPADKPAEKKKFSFKLPTFSMKDFRLKTQVGKSMFRHDYKDDDRDRALTVLTNVFFHLHPVKVRKSGARLGFTWCAGGLSFFVFLTLVVSGITTQVTV